MLTSLTPIDGDAIIPLADAKAHLRILNTAEDTLIGALRDAAIGHVERLSGIALAEAQYLWTMRGFTKRIDLPMRPVTTLDAVVYNDADGAEQTYADARLVDGSVYPAMTGTWPTAYDYAAITFTAGLTSPDDAPELIAAAKLLLGHLFKNREASTERAMAELPLGVDALIQTYRRVLV